MMIPPASSVETAAAAATGAAPEGSATPSSNGAVVAVVGCGAPGSNSEFLKENLSSLPRRKARAKDPQHHKIRGGQNKRIPSPIEFLKT